MGGGSWDVGTYRSNVRAAKAAGKSTFDHTDQIRRGRQAAAANALLDPKVTAGSTSPFAGKVMREVAISAEHPNPTAIGIVLDVTGSNYQAAVTAHGKMPLLHGLLQRKGYVEDPQINFCAVGDAYTDRVPLQVGQFESDNRIDTQLEAIYLEGNGGGQVHETYELAAYFFARHTYLESFDKQGRKGYLFFIGDEMPYDVVRKQHVRDLIGDQLEADIPTRQIFAELQERYHVFFLFQAQGSYDERRILPAWRALLGERALVLDDPAAVCETIALALGLMEGTATLDDGVADLQAAGADLKSIRAASRALATVGANASGSVATTSGTLPSGGAPATTRL